MYRSVKVIKPLGCLAMIDDGELDWKVRATRLLVHVCLQQTYVPAQALRSRALHSQFDVGIWFTGSMLKYAPP